jgi:hypothetical protein
LTENVHESFEFAFAEHLGKHGIVHTTNTSRAFDGDLLIVAVCPEFVRLQGISDANGDTEVLIWVAVVPDLNPRDIYPLESLFTRGTTSSNSLWP